MPRSGQSSYRYQGEWETVSFEGAVLTDTTFKVEIPDRRFGGKIEIRITLQGESYEGNYRYISGPSIGWNGTLTGRHTSVDGEHSLLGTYLEKARAGYAATEDRWNFVIDRPE